MKLDRNTVGRNKYALIKLREVELPFDTDHLLFGGDLAEISIVPTAAIDFGDNADSEFFVIRLKDKYAAPALDAYADAIMNEQVCLSAPDLEIMEYASEVKSLAKKAREHPNSKKPD